jgi:hypothetical protein
MNSFAEWEKIEHVIKTSLKKTGDKKELLIEWEFVFQTTNPWNIKEGSSLFLTIEEMERIQWIKECYLSKPVEEEDGSEEGEFWTGTTPFIIKFSMDTTTEVQFYKLKEKIQELSMRTSWPFFSFIHDPEHQKRKTNLKVGLSTLKIETEDKSESIVIRRYTRCLELYLFSDANSEKACDIVFNMWREFVIVWNTRLKIEKKDAEESYIVILYDRQLNRKGGKRYDPLLLPPNTNILHQRKVFCHLGSLDTLDKRWISVINQELPRKSIAPDLFFLIKSCLENPSLLIYFF